MKDFYWRIATYPGRIIELSVDVLDIESSNNCGKDFLKAFDGDTPNAPVLGTFCGDTTHTTVVTSSRNYLYLHFKADDDKDGKGFRIKWKAVPSSRIVATTTTLSPPTTASVTTTTKITETNIPPATPDTEGKRITHLCYHNAQNGK